MQSQESFFISVWFFILVPLLFVGGLLFRSRILRARHLIYIYFPLSLLASNLVLASRISLLSMWSTKLLFSILATVSIMAPMIFLLKITNLDIDRFDRNSKE